MEITSSAYQRTPIYWLLLCQSLWYAYRLVWFSVYHDVLPVFTADDSFMKADYLIISKKIGTASTISGRTNTFDNSEIDDLSGQKFVTKAGNLRQQNIRLMLIWE